MHFFLLALTPIQVSQRIEAIQALLIIASLFVMFLIFSAASMLVACLARKGNPRTAELYFSSAMTAALIYSLAPISMVATDGFSVLILTISGTLAFIGFSVQWFLIWATVRMDFSLWIHVFTALGFFALGAFFFLWGV